MYADRCIYEQQRHMATGAEPWYWIYGVTQGRKLPYEQLAFRKGDSRRNIQRRESNAAAVVMPSQCSYYHGSPPEPRRLELHLMRHAHGWHEMQSRLLRSALISASSPKRNMKFHVDIGLSKKHAVSEWMSALDVHVDPVTWLACPGCGR